MLFRSAVIAVLFAGISNAGHAADIALPGVNVTITGTAADGSEYGSALKVLLVLTVLSLAPALLIVMTSFTRIIIVLSILRHALGLQQTPPNAVLISLALFLTAFNMMPVFKEINDTSFQPLMANKMPLEAAFERGLKPLHNFMSKQVREKDLALMIELSKQPRPDSLDAVSMWTLVPAFMLSELYAAFQIGFMIFLPFLLIDLVVSAILMSMGMLMVSPMTISLPLKILMFVLVDGWVLIVNALMTSFH